jgi:ATP-dependent Clp protease adaptor protein ClpS
MFSRRPGFRYGQSYLTAEVPWERCRQVARVRVGRVATDEKRLRTMSDGDKREDGGRKDGGRTDGGADTPSIGVVVKARPKTRKPAMYKVLMLNDDYTPMEFVVHVLERFFQKTREEATRIMLHVHRRGVGVCGVFTYEVAETKVTQVMDLARQNQHPLQCTIEKE